MSRSQPVPLVAALVAVLALLLAGCGGADEHDGPTASFASASAGTLTLTDGWVSSVAGASDMPSMSMSGMDGMDGMDTGGSESAAYATITNTGTSNDALVSVSTSAATATLHQTVESADGSSGTMVAVERIVVPASGSVTLQPGGYHVMLTGLTEGFGVGSTIHMTWTFASGTTITTTFPVIDVADRPTSSG
jgi:copper(I)-binding protein